MIFYILLILAAVCGGALGAVLSVTPQPWRTLCAAAEGQSKPSGECGGTGDPSSTGGIVLTALLLAAGGAGLFLGGLCLRARSLSLTAIIDRWFPDRPAKLLGCGLLFGLCCLLGLLAGVLRAKGLRRYFRSVSGSRLHRAAVFGALAGGLLLTAGWAFLVWTPAPAPIRLSEVCCANFSLRADPDAGNYGDYIELVNTGDAPADLAGYYITDNPKKRSKFRLPALTLEPGQTVLLWADGTGRSGTRSGEDIHLSFSLKPGDTVLFSSPRGAVLDQVTVPERYKNTSLTRLDGEWFLAGGTPARDNREAIRYSPPILEAPGFSLEPGFYDGPQTLTLTAPPGCEIRYTLDGSVPYSFSPLYEGPISLTDISDQPNRVVSQPNTTADRSGAITEPVDKGTVVRAAAYDAAGNCSRTVTAVYFVGAETFSKYQGKKLLSIVADPVDLFGYYGIAVTGQSFDLWLEAGGEGEGPWPNYYQSGRAMERDAEITLWDETRSPVLNQSCGIRLQGRSTRARPIKRFRLIAREIYSGSDRFSAPLFGETASHSFFTREDAADVMAQKLAEGLDLGGLDAVPAAVFLNGEFYCETYLRERYDPEYFENHCGLDPEDLILISAGELAEGTEADLEDYLDFLDYVSAHDCADPAVWSEIQARMDLRSYASFVALNLYCGNTDWSDTKNYKVWRSREARDGNLPDGRWHWLVYDMDGCAWCAARYNAHWIDFDTFSAVPAHTETTFLEMPLFADLLKNPEFRDLFVTVWLDLANAVLRPERAETILDAYDMPQRDRDFWLYSLENRPARAMELLIRALDLEAAPCALSLSVSDPAGGGLLLDGYDLPGAALTGTWITGQPLTLTAQPAEGWRFVGWTGANPDTAATVTIIPEGNTNVVAVFERIP